MKKIIIIILTLLYYNILYANIVIEDTGTNHIVIEDTDTIDNSINSNTERSTTGSIFDFEGLMKNAKINEMRFEGSRRVENLLKYSNNFLQDEWIEQLTATKVGETDIVGPSGDVEKVLELSFGTNPSSSIYQTGVFQNVIGSSATASIYARTVSGSTTIRLYVGGVYSPNISINENWKRISFTNTTESANTAFYIKNNSAGNASNVYIAKAMAEDVTGQTNQNPSEFTLKQWQRENLFFDGVDDYVGINSKFPEFNNLSQFSISFKTGRSVYEYYAKVFEWQPVPDENKLHIAPFSTWRNGFHIYINGHLDFSPFVADDAGGIYYYTVAYNGSEVKLYRDGEFKGSLPKIGFNTGTANAFSFGKANYFEGIIADMQVHSREINLTEVQQIHQGNVITSGLIGLWKLNETEGEIAYDTSGNNNHGTLQDFNLFPKYYETENANTVVSNIVSEATGNLISEEKKKGVLIEEQRTNFLIQSENYLAWPFNDNINITNNTHIAPDGKQTADTLTDTAFDGLHRIYQQAVPIGDNTYSASIFVHKNSSIPFMQIRFGGGAGYVWANFDVQNGLVGNSGISGNGIIKSINIFSYDNYYWKIEIVGSLNLISVRPFVISMLDIDFNGIGRNYLGTGDTLIIWGAQLEQGSFPTSYIKTAATTVTRTSDNLTYELEYFPQEFIISADITPISDGNNYAAGEFRFFSTDDSRGNNYKIRTFGAAAYGFQLQGGGGNFNLDTADFQKGITAKLSFVLKQEGGNIRAKIIKDGIEKLNTAIAGTLDHSNSGILNIGKFGTDRFNGNFKNIELIDLAIDEKIIDAKNTTNIFLKKSDRKINLGGN
jgi:hypothetical protein